jgi:hypothetical protein
VQIRTELGPTTVPISFTTTYGGRRIVLRLQPPPQPGESIWRLVERVAAAIARADEV